MSGSAAVVVVATPKVCVTACASVVSNTANARYQRGLRVSKSLARS